MAKRKKPATENRFRTAADAAGHTVDETAAPIAPETTLPSSATKATRSVALPSASVPDMAPAQPETPTASAVDAPASMDSRDRIATRAHELYLERGGDHGADLEDWLEAERQVAPTPER